MCFGHIMSLLSAFSVCQLKTSKVKGVKHKREFVQETAGRLSVAEDQRVALMPPLQIIDDIGLAESIINIGHHASRWRTGPQLGTAVVD